MAAPGRSTSSNAVICIRDTTEESDGRIAAVWGTDGTCGWVCTVCVFLMMLCSGRLAGWFGSGFQAWHIRRAADPGSGSAALEAAA